MCLKRPLLDICLDYCTNRPPMPPFGFRCGILRPLGSFGICDIRHRNLSGSRASLKNAMRAEYFSEIDFSENSFLPPKSGVFVLDPGGVYDKSEGGPE